MASAEEAKAAYIAKMGEELGTQFAQLWQDVVFLCKVWTEFVELFGTKPSRVELLNMAAPRMTRVIQDALWEATLLNIARLTDPSNSLGSKNKANLTIQNLPKLVDDPTLRSSIEKLVRTASDEAAFCRDWRNRHIAHRDLDLALDRTATPLAEASRARVKGALVALVNVLNAVEGHYMNASTYYDLGFSIGGAISLLYVIDDGLRAQEAREKRLLQGKPSDEDLAPRHL
jgi:hypothetical protein